MSDNNGRLFNVLHFCQENGFRTINFEGHVVTPQVGTEAAELILKYQNKNRKVINNMINRTIRILEDNGLPYDMASHTSKTVILVNTDIVTLRFGFFKMKDDLSNSNKITIVEFGSSM